MIIKSKYLVVAAMCLLETHVCLGGEDELDTFIGARSMVTLATGYPEHLSTAPATAWIITSADMKARGARTLRDALQAIPGFIVSTSDVRDTNINVRGITSRVLILHDGVPVAHTWLQPYQSMDGIALTNVERIEVVRGPGSSLYGADAVAGVINLISKTSQERLTPEIGAHVGSFDSYGAYFLGSLDGSAGRFNLSLNARTSNLFDEMINVDAQTVIDARLRTRASLAPTKLPAHRDIVDVQMDYTYQRLTVRATYLDQFNWETGIGLAEAVDPNAEANSRLAGGTVLYKFVDLPEWQVSGLIDYSDVRQTTEGALYPPGAFGGTFPDGVLEAFDARNQRARGEATAIYSGFAHHTLRFGLGALYNEYDLLLDKRNFIVRNGRIIPTGQFEHLGGVNDTPSLPNVEQTDAYLYVQDEWTIRPDWTLTAGARVDNYSDFGTTVNPRAALVWAASQDWSYKLMYGRAFRPPALFEAYSNGIYASKGNPDIQPTTLDSLEASIERSIVGSSMNRLTVFTYKQSDLIQSVADPTSIRGTSYINKGEQRGIGLEFDSEWTIREGLSVRGSYAFQQRQGDDTDNNVNIRYAPKHSLNLGFFAEFPADWITGLHATSIIGRERPTSDPRPPQDDYTLVTLTVQRLHLLAGIDVEFAIHNLLDEDARVQSASPVNTPEDIPLPGRSFTFTVLKKW